MLVSYGVRYSVKKKNIIISKKLILSVRFKGWVGDRYCDRAIPRMKKWFWKHSVFQSFSSPNSICNYFLTNVKTYPGIWTLAVAIRVRTPRYLFTFVKKYIAEHAKHIYLFFRIFLQNIFFSSPENLKS